MTAKFAVYILAGGKSSRMGEDKSLLPYHESNMLSTIIHIAKELSNSIYLVSGHEAHQKFGLSMLDDLHPALGPAGGLGSLLQHSKHSMNLVLSCDMPCVDVNNIHYIFSQISAHQIGISTLGKYTEAFPGFYAKSIEEKWHQLVASGIYSMHELISNFDSIFVDGKEIVKSNPNFFKNINTPEDYNQLIS
ncbi:MAG: molybdenum cofactor guanylyltransferase [Chitinophagaceae bacterium]|nr:molybdenum cofactor guanylyltransferase [Chitinophagaceae bacterium]